MTNKRKLTPKQQRFVDEYLVDLNGKQAAIRAGYAEKRAEITASELVRNRKVAEAIKLGMEKREQRTEITQDMVLQRYWQIATADPNELIQYRRECCRHCFGEGHAYQWIDEAEFMGAVASAQLAKDGVPIPTNDGGYGFDPSIRPHPKCPKCHGDGRGNVFAADTRYLSEGARTLFAGVKVTKEGLEVKMHDQLAALRDVGRHVGLFAKDNEQAGSAAAAAAAAAATVAASVVRTDYAELRKRLVEGGKGGS